MIENIMKTCCILHNMLLESDGIGIESYLNEAMWDNLDPDLPDEIAESQMDTVEDEATGSGSIDEDPEIAFSRTAINLRAIGSIPLLKQFGTTSQLEYNYLRKLLVTHFNQKVKMQQVVWPKSVKSNHRANIGYFSRAKQEAENALYHKLSHLRCRNRNGEHTVLIGDGLFSHIMYFGKKRTPSGETDGEPIAQFRGDIKSEEQYNNDARQGKGGYAIRINRSTVLDCWDKFNARLCKASWANSHKNCLDTITNTNAKANAYITVNQTTHIVQLRALTIITPHTEILWEYQNEYVFPTLH
jgi:hypothetical protein